MSSPPTHPVHSTANTNPPPTAPLEASAGKKSKKDKLANAAHSNLEVRSLSVALNKKINVYP